MIGFGLQSASKILKIGLLQSAIGLQTAADYKMIQYRCSKNGFQKSSP